MRLLILDRDGVINADSPDYVKSPAEWRALPGSLDAIGRANAAGYTVAVASNQSGVGRGLFDLDSLAAIHRRMQAELAEHGGRIDGIFFCPHRPDAGCDCRKPEPGLLRRIAAHYGTSLAGVWMVGDSRKDLQAARAAGATPILVRTGNGRQTEASLEANSGVPTYDDLAGAVDALLAKTSES